MSEDFGECDQEKLKSGELEMFVISVL